MGTAESYFNGDMFADYGIVSVAANYRLGPFGFLSLPNEPLATGNQVRMHA